MGDEIRVTLIATGFDQRPQRAAATRDPRAPARPARPRPADRRPPALVARDLATTRSTSRRSCADARARFGTQAARLDGPMTPGVDPARPPCRFDGASRRLARVAGCCCASCTSCSCPASTLGPALLALRARRRAGARVAAVPLRRRRLAGAARAPRLAADRRRRARVGARRDLLHGRPLDRRGDPDPLARRRRLPALPAARARRRRSRCCAPAPATCPATLWVDGVTAALAVAAVSAALVFETVLDNASGPAARGRGQPRLPARRPRPARRRRRRARRHRLAADRTWVLLARRRRRPSGWPTRSTSSAARQRHATSRAAWFDIGWWLGLLLDRRSPRGSRARRATARRRRRAPARHRPCRSASASVGLGLLVYGCVADLNPLAVGARRARRCVAVMARAHAHLPRERRDAAHLARRGADRRADRARQPPRARRARSTSCCREADDARPARARALRPRRLQALQRHLRPPGRRRAARPPRRATSPPS